MINTNYGNLYSQYMNYGNQKKNNGKVADKTHMSKNSEMSRLASEPRPNVVGNGSSPSAKPTPMEYLTNAKAKTEAAKQAAQPKKTADESKAVKKDGEITQEDIRKLYAQLNGINYGEYDEADSYKNAANTFLNEMVFSHMNSSDLFVPSVSRNVLSAMFQTSYDSSELEEKIRNYGVNDTMDNFDIEEDE